MDYIEYVIKSKEGDEKSLEWLINRFQDMAVGYAYSILHDFQRAEDAAQEAFILVCRNIQNLKEPVAFISWLRKLIFNICYRMARKQRFEVSIDDIEEPADENGDINENIEHDEMTALVNSALCRLTEGQQEVFLLCYTFGKSYEEIAADLQITVSAVDNRLYSGKKKLKSIMLNTMKDYLGGYIMNKEAFTKKVLENAKYPTGWEYWKFPSCFASLWMRIESITENRQKLITQFAIVSGISHVQLDMTNENHFVPDIGYNELKALDEYDDYIKFTMGFAGYSYARYNKSTDKTAIFTEIKKSIDVNRPVLMNFGANYSWNLIIGYDDQRETLYDIEFGCEDKESYWENKPCINEDGMFVTDHWYEYMTEAVVVTGKSTPTVTYDDVFRRLIDIMETMEKAGYVKHSADYLKDDVNFKDYDDEKYLELAGRIASLIALLIDQRSWVKNFFYDNAKAEAFQDKAQYFRRIGALYEISADICWIAWHMVGAFVEKPELSTENCARLLPSPIYRRTIAELIDQVINNDRYILDCLKEMMGV